MLQVFKCLSTEVVVDALSCQCPCAMDSTRFTGYLHNGTTQSWQFQIEIRKNPNPAGTNRTRTQVLWRTKPNPKVTDVQEHSKRGILLYLG